MAASHGPPRACWRRQPYPPLFFFLPFLRFEYALLPRVCGPSLARDSAIGFRSGQCLVRALSHPFFVRQWDSKRVRAWLNNHRERESASSFTASAKDIAQAKPHNQPSLAFAPLGHSSESITYKRSGSLVAERAPVCLSDDRMLKRAVSATALTVEASPPLQAVSALLSSSGHSNVEQRKLETFFRLEHTRIPVNPQAIFQLTTGDELASQLSFNWLLEERVVASCEAIVRAERLPASAFVDGADVVTSRIDPFVADATPLAAERDDVVLPVLPAFTDDFASDPFGTSTRPLSPSTLLFGKSPPALGPRGEQLARFEPAPNEPQGGDDDDLQPMDVLGVASALRSASSLVQNVRVPSAPVACSSVGMHSSTLVVCCGGDSSFLGLVQVSPDGLLQVQEHFLAPEPSAATAAEHVHSVALDSERKLVWAASGGKHVHGYKLHDVAGGPMFRCTTGAASPSPFAPLLLRGSMVYLAHGSNLAGWDADELDVSSSSCSDYSSHGGDHESLSSYSEGESSPPLSAHREIGFYGSIKFTQRLQSAISRHFCMLCGQSTELARDCSECRAHVCMTCSNVYKLTSLGEVKPRSICNGCIPSIRRRIHGQQQHPANSMRMPSLLDRGRTLHAPAPIVKSASPSVTQVVDNRGGGASVPRVIRFLDVDHSTADGLLVGFDGRPSSLSWSVESACAHRWFVGHTAPLSSIASTAAEPHLMATGSMDRSAKVWDSRVRRASMTLDGHANAVDAIALACPGAGSTFCFTGGVDECIKVWDLRKPQALYELSTGNNQVRGLAWSATASALLATTMCPHPPSTSWPAEAVRGPRHFPRRFDLGYNAVLAYSFVAE